LGNVKTPHKPAGGEPAKLQIGIPINPPCNPNALADYFPLKGEMPALRKASAKPAKAASQIQGCPHNAIAVQLGCNWAWAYYHTAQQAAEVAEWISQGGNDNWHGGGRCSTDPIARNSDLGGLFEIRYQLDNTRQPAKAANCRSARSIKLDRLK